MKCGDDEKWDPYEEEEILESIEEDGPDDVRRKFQQAKLNFETSGRARYDAMLDEARRSSPPGGVVLPTPEEVAWMTEEERRCVEWFDRREYNLFMKRSAWYEGDGWVIPYCRMVCDEFKRASQEVLDDFANDYIWCFPIPADYGGNIYVGGEVSRKDRFLRVADKIFEAAESGNGRAQNAVGMFCESGRPEYAMPFLKKHLGIEVRDGAIVRELYRKSAEGGCLQGQRNYARALLKGIGGRWRTIDKSGDATWHRDRMRADRQLGVEWFRKVAEERGDGECQMRLARIYAYGNEVPRDVAKCLEWLRKAAQNGNPNAVAVVRAVGEGRSAERLFAELLIFDAEALLKSSSHDYGIDYSIGNIRHDGRRDVAEARGKDWLLKDSPEGTVVPPPASRETLRTPNLLSANPSFAARLIILVRDRFGNDAPSIYRAAHVSRKTYSSIVSNELRPVSKQTAVAFALALRLSQHETIELLKSAGFSLSDFILEDMIVKVCIQTGINDIDEVNEILAAHGAKTFPKGEDVP